MGPSPSPLDHKAKISEVFRSIQGEGKYAGVPQVFVRFFGCHMHCVWCDTPDSIGDGKQEFQEYGITDLLKEIRPLAKGCHSISLTGGEPLMQVDFLREFLPSLKAIGFTTYLETSGVLYQALAKVVRWMDIIAMDLKLPSSTGCRPFWKEHKEFLQIARRKEGFIKTVISKDTTPVDIMTAVRLVAKIAPETTLILQPNTFDLNHSVVQRCLDMQNVCRKYLEDVRILPQLHKFMNLR